MRYCVAYMNYCTGDLYHTYYDGRFNPSAIYANRPGIEWCVVSVRRA